MKKLTLLASAAILALPAMAFAQSTVQNGAETRAQVRADLIAVEKAGYDPARSNDDYPADLQAAEAKVSAEEGIRAPKPETRAQVRQDLVKVEKAGYDPFRVEPNYPLDIEHAEAKLSKTSVQPVQVSRKALQATSIPRIDEPRNPFFDGA
ncbi:DUF4148 domain-containing protein [Cupriavidus agavae]|uniref:Uncharacterized protein DUF4148 n=1 Tax=Cupriavidus agavae TaxID=1001822 RepID=A0A4Q7RZU2_9BURK|nr:DUF4148 domain-containing protein [Cupriavidus agavae]RZT39416.1 uncharacterized protein DUF4148 [Cupriavidus agavae]